MGKLLKISPEWFLRLGLGGVYLYTSIDIFLHPKGWYWAVRGLPQFMQSGINNLGVDNYLKVQAAGEFAIALMLLLWFLPKALTKVAALLAALQMLAILLLVGVGLDTFRDIGLLGAGLALFTILKKDSTQ